MAQMKGWGMTKLELQDWRTVVVDRHADSGEHGVFGRAGR